MFYLCEKSRRRISPWFILLVIAMKFYDRKLELQQLADIRQIAFSNHSQMTVVTGRRRIGKTKLIMKSCEGSVTVYLFVSRNNEAALCGLFADELRRALGCYVPDGVQSFVQLFELIMVVGKSQSFNLVIDEIQEFYNINPAIFSGIQDVWDRYKDVSHVNFVASGSVYTLMHQIFLNYKEPLYGRCDTIIRLRPFATDVLHEILHNHYANYTNDDLLALYTLTGGVPKYIELLMDRGAFTVADMISRVTEPNSIFLEEGTILLASEFGKKYGNYFAILSAIASGHNTAAAIAQTIGSTEVGGMLSRLEEDYELINKRRPMLSKERSQNVRYEISDNFMRFWFRYVARNQSLLQMGLNEQLRDIVMSDYQTYSGLTLEMWFRQKLRESGKYSQVSSWWNVAKGTNVDQMEIDVVALSLHNSKSAYVAEVKRQRKNFKPELLQKKVEFLRTKILDGYEVEADVLTLDDM
jgi:hypothetical protein